MLNGSSNLGQSTNNSVTGVPAPAGAKPGEPRPLCLCRVIW